MRPQWRVLPLECSLGVSPIQVREVPRAREGVDSAHLRARRARRQQPDAGDFHRAPYARIGACLLRQRALQIDGARFDRARLLQQPLEERTQLLRQQGALIMQKVCDAFQGHAPARGVCNALLAQHPAHDVDPCSAGHHLARAHTLRRHQRLLLGRFQRYRPELKASDLQG